MLSCRTICHNSVSWFRKGTPQFSAPTQTLQNMCHPLASLPFPLPLQQDGEDSWRHKR